MKKVYLSLLLSFILNIACFGQISVDLDKNKLYEITLSDSTILKKVKILNQESDALFVYYEKQQRRILNENIISLKSGGIEYAKPTPNELDSVVARRNRKVGVSLVLGGEILFGISLDFFIAPEIKFEVTGSPIGYGGGMSYYLPYHIKKWTPFIGIRGGHYFVDFLGKTIYDDIYVPVGLSFYSLRGLYVSFDGGIISKSIYSEPLSGFCIFGCGPNPPTRSKYTGPMFTIKIGHRFNTKRK